MDLKMGSPSNKGSVLSSAVQWCFYVVVIAMCGYSFVRQHRLEQRLRVLEDQRFQLVEPVYSQHEPTEEVLQRKTRDVTDCICPSEITLQKKWKGLRGCFTRELRRQEKFNVGTNSGPRKSEYTHFQQMLFLKKVVTSRPSCTGSADYIYYDESVMRLDVKKEESNVHGYNKLEEANVESDDDSDPLKEVDRCKPKKPKYDTLTEDDDKLFLLSMLRTLQRIPTAQKMSIKIKLLTVLDEATRNLDP